MSRPAKPALQCWVRSGPEAPGTASVWRGRADLMGFDARARMVGATKVLRMAPCSGDRCPISYAKGAKSPLPSRAIRVLLPLVVGQGLGPWAGIGPNERMGAHEMTNRGVAGRSIR